MTMAIPKEVRGRITARVSEMAYYERNAKAEIRVGGMWLPCKILGPRNSSGSYPVVVSRGVKPLYYAATEKELRSPQKEGK